ncbi:hypothetical protein TanjilG_11193 [Lupinus angustifolius]|uniref:RAVE complex protein Rav1 C-terminal domain-containing protein n=1 Tax=Lupinus angustifolius TaxID=3871 RepID=A0A1J7HPB9_LUPAN|nr:PREDICTED: uncharacterized protein LOC109360262 [Lupinus angustifolius]OIW02299.1 hypothetical protein TanjilG_11193 [Lupinus angustifolius]
MTETIPSSSSSSSSLTTKLNPIDHFPLHLHRSDVVPPAPTFSQSTIDFLPNFSGYTWIAYGASSILVITHFPSPLSASQTRIGPIFRQPFQLSSPVTAVSWSPATPSSGDLAAAAQNCIEIFRHQSATSRGSFCWRQNAVLVQQTKVEAIRWTESGDGIISGGMEVVFWKKSNQSWEIAWKFKADQPQTLVCATWSIEGPSATAAQPSKGNIKGSSINEVSNCVLVCQSNGLSEYSKVKLRHPLPVTMIQWRPSRGRISNRYEMHPARHVLLTCCLDGTARLWSEIDSGKSKRTGKDMNDQKNTGRNFCVIAVIEINQVLKGTLGSDIFVTWGTEIRGIFKTGEDAKQVFFKEEFDHDVRKCDWLVGFGPGMLLSFWAVHCLDDVSPMRFPRVTLWRKHELQDNDIGDVYKFNSSDFKNALLLHKFIMLRNCLSGPPVICSPLQLLPCNSLVWSFFRIQAIHDHVENSHRKDTDNISTHLTGGVLNIDGHSGEILKVSVHPYICEVQFAASLDSNGMVLFWSLSNISNCILGHPTLIPSWELCGKLATQGSCSRYTTLRWAPSVLDDKLIFFMGHARGIDCFIVDICRVEEENIECHYLCTIPFSGHGPYEDGPCDIFAIPLNSTCNKTFLNNKLMLLAIWKGRFQALSWEVILHSFDMPTSSCECNFDAKSLDDHSVWAFESTFVNKRYFITVNPCSSEFPSSTDLVTSFAVVDAGTLSHRQPEFDFVSDLGSSYLAYTMATGYSDGSLKLWRSNPGNPLTLHLPWELVGSFVAHDGPINGICFSDCGQKIATCCNGSNSNTVNTIHIWDAVHLISAGTFILEDKLTVESYVIALNWMTLGTGQLLLGVCLKNELQVYAPRRYDGLTSSNCVNFPKVNIWIRIAFAHTPLPIYDFSWGPRASAVVIHGNYFSIFSHWLLHVDNKQGHMGEIYEDRLSAVFTDCDIGAFRELSNGNNYEDNDSMRSIKINMKDNNLFSSLFLPEEQLKSEPLSNNGLWSILEVAETISGSLPTYHPNVLLTNISSGNWKRAFVAVRHLVECLTSNDDPKKRYIAKRTGLPDITLPYYLEGLISKSSKDKEFQWGGDSASVMSISQAQSSSDFFPFHSGSSAENKSTTSTKSELNGFVESLENFPELSHLISIEKSGILAIIDLLCEVSSPHSSSPYQSLDEPGRRFWVALRYKQLLFHRKFTRAASFEELLVNSRLFVWAYHTDCLEDLFGSVIPSEPTWQEMRALGVGFWYTSVPQLRARMEKLARARYLKNKSPRDCALLYIALNRVQVLAGLFKISKDEKDKPLVGFLSRNFQDEKNKAAALKNAYVLLGKHQVELAIAFFLLGGDHSSAINICAKNLGDEQLALVICRLVEGSGGPLEHQLITKYILPSAIDKGDYWLASLLEWEIGNYYQSFHRMLEFSVNRVAQESIVMSSCGPFLDPSVGVYCQMLATKNSMKNVVGEQNSAILLRWATLMTVTALKRCGNPLEALEYFSSSLSMLGTADQGSELGDEDDVLSSTLKPFPRKSSNWLSADVSAHLEFHIKLNLALQYLTKLIREHPSWPGTLAESNVEAYYSDEYVMQHEKSVESFKQRLYAGLTLFEQRFLLSPFCLISMTSLLLSHHGLLYIGYDMADGCTPGELSQKSNIIDAFKLCHSRVKPVFKTVEEISVLYSRFFSACSMDYSQQSLTYIEKSATTECGSKFLNASQCQFEGHLISFWYLRSILRIQLDSISKDLVTKQLYYILDLFEYYLHFSLAWLERNSEALLFMMGPFLVHSNGHNPYEVDMVNLKKIIPKIAEMLTQNSCLSNIQNLQVSKCAAEDKQAADIKHSIPDDERWRILGTCLFQHMSRFMISNLNLVLDQLEYGNVSGSSHRDYANREYTVMSVDSDNISLLKQIRLVSLSLCDLLMTTVNHVSSYHVKQLADLLWQKCENNLNVVTFEWLKQPSQSESNDNQDLDILELVNRKDKYLVHQLLWDHCTDSKLISDCFAQEKLNWSSDLDHRPTKGWNDMYIIMKGLHKTDDDTHDNGCKLSPKSSSHDVGSPVKGKFPSDHAYARSNQKDAICMDIGVFQNPKELCKRNGELLEALCINSTDQREAALATNRKGIVFFHLEDGIPYTGESDVLWAKADWPQNGWAGSESTPAPTCVSPGVGLGSKKGVHLGLGGATVGVNSSAWPSRDLIAGGGFGILSYAGNGASGLRWEVQQDFEDFVDPPATLENISSKALSSHPMRPFFLVGSSNTHIYLWEFNKDKATATYGVLPAANVPPPYALASISALQFDHFGHRFASAGLDGTVCTWQLEVGGRSNVRPTESSLCFNGHASDVTYFSSSGSIIAVAGYSSNAVNVVIWDTLAPPTTSRASILCHEGGARSLSVLDNHVGSGSVSPLIVTGGKGGDVGVHDFRYIATGKGKRHRHTDNIGQSSITSLTHDKDHNVDGMLWYIPKAHSGSVTKVVTIPNTSMFLTGGTDGDVKLWDAQNTKLIHQWSKIHEKHTFLQPSSRGFGGGVVRAAVTDIQVVPDGFLTCGGDGTVKWVRLNSQSPAWPWI